MVFGNKNYELPCNCMCSCGSVVEHCVNSAKGCGFNSQGTHILRKTCIAWMHCKSLWIKASAKCINVIFTVNAYFQKSLHDICRVATSAVLLRNWVILHCCRSGNPGYVITFIYIFITFLLIFISNVQQYLLFFVIYLFILIIICLFVYF